MLFRPEFITGVDESYGGGGQIGPICVLKGPAGRPALRFDSDLMSGTTPRAERALAALDREMQEGAFDVVLDCGDMLVLDNNRVAHGRRSFIGRLDGTDRWLQRALVLRTPSDAQHVSWAIG